EKRRKKRVDAIMSTQSPTTQTSEDPTSSHSQPSVTPSEAELTTELRSLRHTNPKTGAAKLLLLLKQKQPTWSVSEKRVKKVLKDQGLMVVEEPSSVHPSEESGHQEEGSSTSLGTQAINTGGGTSSSSKKKKSKSAVGGGSSLRYEHPVSATTDAVDPHKWSNRVDVK
ncbi:4213_t:CDS:1, partial [Acaulospora colombiana]